MAVLLMQLLVLAVRQPVPVVMDCFVPHLKKMVLVQLVHRVVKRLVFIQIVLHVTVVLYHVRLVVGCTAMQLQCISISHHHRQVYVVNHRVVS